MTCDRRGRGREPPSFRRWFLRDIVVQIAALVRLLEV